MVLATMHDLMIAELKDLHGAETQLVTARPGMVNGAATPSLRTPFGHHLEPTHKHVARLGVTFDILGLSARGTKCKGLQGLLTEGAQMLDQDGDDTASSADIIASSHRVEHHTIAFYASTLAFATLMRHSDIAEFLELTLNEKKEADELLSTIADREVNSAAPCMKMT